MAKVGTNHFLQNQIESSKREAREFSEMVSSQLDNGIDRETVVSNVQRSIEGTDIEMGFVCMLDWSGVEICHPDPQKIGKQTNPDESYVRSIDNEIDSEDFYDLLTDKKPQGGIRDFSNSSNSEVIYLYPVKNSDWIIAAHANIDRIEKQIAQLKFNFLLIYLLSSTSIVMLCLLTVRFLGSYYEKALEIKNEKLAEEVVNLSKLNTDLNNYRTKINKKFEEENAIGSADEGDAVKIKNRLLTFSKDKLVSIKVEEIASIKTTNSITWITCLDGKKYTSNSSLDELYHSLDPMLFFRANRQYIISVKGIEEILRYGNNQLKIKLNPASTNDIIISKNKASEFKKWLNM